MKMKNKNLKNVGALILLLLAVIAAILIVCKYRLDKKESAQPVTIGDLANPDSESANCVYVRENGKYVPFLVITNNYEDGYTLLLRKEILEEEHRMNDYSSFYQGSEIDTFLNRDYFNELGEIRKKIKNVSLAIVDRDSIGSSGSGTINIKRHVFLLSARELCYGVENEGRELEYFNTPDHRIAEYHGEPASWLLRTPSTFYLSAVCGIAQDGQLSSANTYDKFGIRPAFCVDSAEKIIEKEGIANGKKVYVIE